MKKLLTVFLFCLLTFGMTSTVSAADWKWIVASDKVSYYFDTQSFVATSSVTYSVLIKQEFTEATGKILADKFGVNKTIAYGLLKREYDFRYDKKIRRLAIAVYDKDGTVLSSSDKPSEWTEIFPDSIGETVFNATYSYYLQNY